jgi:hypothetical protein
MSDRILVGFYAIKLATDGHGSPVWTMTDRRTAKLVVVAGQPLEFDEQAEAEKWARANSKAARS